MAPINKLIAIISFICLFTLGHTHLAVIQNHCPFDVWVTSVPPRDANTIQPRLSIIPSNGQYLEPYQLYPVGSGGQSLKIHKTKELVCNGRQVPITQFEYTIDSKIWFDLSDVDCSLETCPIAKHGLFLHTDRSDCHVAMCAPGEIPCKGAYLFDKDDIKSRSCWDVTAKATLHLCTEFMPDYPQVVRPHCLGNPGCDGKPPCHGGAVCAK